MERCATTDEQTIALLKQVYNGVYQHTESFEEEDIGADLAYLIGAILEGTMVVWPPDRPILQVLRGAISYKSPVWEYIAVV